MTQLTNLHGEPRTPNGANKRSQPTFTYATNCSRCGGTGVYTWHTYLGPASGTCFLCGGNGRGRKVVERLYTPEELVKAQARSQAAKDRTEAKRRAKLAERDAEFARAGAEADTLADELGTQAAIEEIQNRLDTARDANVRWHKMQLANLYQRATRERFERQELAKQRKREQSQHIGQVGERLELTLRVVHVHQYQVQAFSGYGVESRYITICEDDNGNAVVYKGSNMLEEKGWTIRVKATVKAHDERDGVRQTIIQRPKVLETIGEGVTSTLAS